MTRRRRALPVVPLPELPEAEPLPEMPAPEPLPEPPPEMPADEPVLDDPDPEAPALLALPLPDAVCAFVSMKLPPRPAALEVLPLACEPEVPVALEVQC